VGHTARIAGGDTERQPSIRIDESRFEKQYGAFDTSATQSLETLGYTWLMQSQFPVKHWQE